MLDYIMENLWQAWAIVSVLCLLLELTSGDFFFICFAIGACLSAIVAPFANLYVQLAVFSVATVLSLYFLRPYLLHHLHGEESNRETNADAIIGQFARVSEEIKVGNYGRVKLGGDDWKAESESQEVLPVGTRVRILSRKGLIVVVEKVD